MDDDLGKAVVVAKVDEKDSAMVAKAEHPAGKLYGFARIGGAKFIAGMGTIRMHDFSPLNLPRIIPYFAILPFYGTF
jgi:hypothetical protein